MSKKYKMHASFKALVSDFLTLSEEDRKLVIQLARSLNSKGEGR